MPDDKKPAAPAADKANDKTVTPVDTKAQDKAATERKEDGGYQ